ncbi:MAG: hypothetical protein MUE70_13460 [Desulfobacterales bacterium]|jgi:hypothetical protein|nr:hypothetical protein [Desulfobacterales bacterium]
MSKKHPECPLYNPLNCKEYYNPKLCAFVRKDRICLKKKKPKPLKTSQQDTGGAAKETKGNKPKKAVKPIMAAKSVGTAKTAKTVKPAKAAKKTSKK